MASTAVAIPSADTTTLADMIGNTADVDTRIILLFKDYKVLIVSELLNKDLHSALQNVRNIKITDQLTLTGEDNQIVEPAVKDLQNMLLTFLVKNRDMLSLSELPTDVAESYKLNKVVTINA